MATIRLGLQHLFDISVVLNGVNEGQWSRSSSAVVDAFGYGPDGNFVAFDNHSNNRYGNNNATWANGFANPRDALPLPL